MVGLFRNASQEAIDFISFSLSEGVNMEVYLFNKRRVTRNGS
jgi:hypothetical protein